MNRVVPSFAAIAIAIVLAASTASAQGPAGPTSADAEMRFREGLVLAKQGKPEEARVKYLQSYALDPRPNVLLSLAIVKHQTGRHVAAIRHLRPYLQSSQATRVEELKSTLLHELEQSTGHFRIKMTAGTELRLDGGRASDGLMGDVLDVEPGKHVLAAGAEQRDVVVSRG